MTRRLTPKPGKTTHVTVRCNNKNYLLNPKAHFDEIVSWVNCLPCIYDCKLHHVMVMSNHIHLMITPSHDNIGKAMSYFLTNLSKFLNYRNRSSNHIFGNRYVPTIIENERHHGNVIRYVYQNPVKAKMVKQIEAYPYSSLSFYLGTGNRGLMLTPDIYTKELFSAGTSGLLKWKDEVSNTMSQAENDIIRASLRRSRFKLSILQIRKILAQGLSIKI